MAKALAALLALVATAVLTPAAAKNLRINEPIKLGLIATGALNTPLDQAKKPVLKKALETYRAVFNDGKAVDDERPEIEGQPQQLIDALGFKTVKDGLGHEVLLPTKVLPETWFKFDGLETMWRASEKNEIWVLTFRHGLTNNPPSELLQNILAASREPKDITVKQTNLHFFVSLRDYLPDPGVQSHQYKQAFAVTDGRVGLFITFRDIIPEGFTLPTYLAPWATYWAPPDALFAADTTEARAEVLDIWLSKKHLTDLQRQEIEALGTGEGTVTREQVRAMTDMWAWRKTMTITRQWIANAFAKTHRYKGVKIKDCLTHRNQKKGINTNVRILYSTNRAPTAAIDKDNLDPASWYGNQPAREGNQTIGCATVSVPLKQPPNADLKAVYQDTWFQGRQRVDDDDEKLFRVARAARLGDISLSSAANHLKFTDTESWLFRREDVALVFVHGYNTSFENALYRTAQIAAAANYPGRVYLYSWPSAESAMDYLSDMDMAERSEVHFSEFMRAIFRDPEMRKVDIVAHSMGAQLLTRALSDLKDLFYSRADVKIRQVILAAPDVAVEVFANKIREIKSLVGGVTVFGSKEDVPLWWSRTLRSGPPRLGRYVGTRSDHLSAVAPTATDGTDTDNPTPTELPASKLPADIKVVDATRGGNACNFWGYSPFDISNSHTYFTREPVASSLREALSRAARNRSQKAEEAAGSDDDRAATCWWKVW